LCVYDIFISLCSLYIGGVNAEGKHAPGLLALAYQRLAETRGLAAATQVIVVVVFVATL